MAISILITGASGFVGRALSERFLQKDGVHLFLTDKTATVPKLEKKNCRGTFEYVPGDLSSRHFMDNLDQRGPFHHIIHLAAMLPQHASKQNLLEIVNANNEITSKILDIAVKHKSKFIFPSTAMVYGNRPGPFVETMLPAPPNAYALTKLLSEELIRYYRNTHKLEYCIFRASVLYGPGQRGPMFIPSLMDSLIRGEKFPMTKGEQIRDFLYIDDFVELLRRAVELKEVTGLFNACSGSVHTMKDTALLACEIAGRSHLLQLGALSYREDELWDYRLDNTHARQTFSWSPGTNLEQGLLHTLQSVRAALQKT